MNGVAFSCLNDFASKLDRIAYTHKHLHYGISSYILFFAHTCPYRRSLASHPISKPWEPCAFVNFLLSSAYWITRDGRLLRKTRLHCEASVFGIDQLWSSVSSLLPASRQMDRGSSIDNPRQPLIDPLTSGESSSMKYTQPTPAASTTLMMNPILPKTKGQGRDKKKHPKPQYTERRSSKDEFLGSLSQRLSARKRLNQRL